MIYQLLIRLALPLIVAIIGWDAHKRKGGKTFVLQRLGLYYPSALQGAIWIHCASVGEVKAIEMLVKSAPNQAWLITTNTPTGLKMAQQLALPNTALAYCPIDLPFSIQRFLNRYQPSQLWVVETELWPNLYRLCSERHIPISLINARLSDKTLNAPDWLKIQYQKCLKQTSKILARSQREAERFIALGADERTTRVLGNLKQTASITSSDYPKPIEQEYLLLASSHEDEEKNIVQRWLALNPAEKLVIVPRHVKRGRQLKSRLGQLDIAVGLASIDSIEAKNWDIWIDDSFGQLMGWYAHAKLVIMGGSFVAKGGHNFYEPAALRKTIITGPDNRDFEDEIKPFLEHNALFKCHDYDQLMVLVEQLMTNSALRETTADKAFRLLNAMPDITEQYCKALELNNLQLQKVNS